MKHVYLSPHLDDAVLSCGGAIHRQTSAGETVRVVTLFAEDATPGVDLSDFALDLHGQWGNVPRPMALRRAEDLAALTLLGAEGVHLDYHDAVYRAGPAGEWLYPDAEALFEWVHTADPLDSLAIADRLARLIPQEDEMTLYAPLGVGGHVDHQVTQAAARALLGPELFALGCRLALYEDYPYAEQAGAVEAALVAADALHAVPGEGAPDTDRGSLCPALVPLDPADVAAKVSALGYYQSQMSMLFDGAAAMPNRVWCFAATQSPDVCLAERVWWLE